MIELKSFKKWSICRQAQLCRSNGLKVTEVWSWCPKNLLGKKLTLATKKSNCLFVSVSHPSNEKNIAKSMTILKLCERSFKWDLSGCPNFNRLEMALGWRQVVKNLEIYYVILRGYLYFNIKIKHVELDICSWRHFRENSKLFNLPMDIEYQRQS